MDYIEKLNLQTEEVKEVELENLEKHIITNSDPFTVDEYIGHERDFLAVGDEYDDGFNQLNETNGLGISCIVSKEVKEARQGNEKLVDNIQGIKEQIEQIAIRVFEKNEGEVDDSPRLQRTLDYAKSLEGNKVILLSGTYLLSEALKLTNNHNNITLQGDGSAILKRDSIGTDKNCITMIGADNWSNALEDVKITNIKILGDGAVGHGIHLTNCHYLEIDNVLIDGFAKDNKYALYVGGDCWTNFFNKCNIKNSYNGLFVGERANSCVFTNCVFFNIFHCVTNVYRNTNTTFNTTLFEFSGTSEVSDYSLHIKAHNVTFNCCRFDSLKNVIYITDGGNDVFNYSTSICFGNCYFVPDSSAKYNYAIKINKGKNIRIIGGYAGGSSFNSSENYTSAFARLDDYADRVVIEGLILNSLLAYSKSTNFNGYCSVIDYIDFIGMKKIESVDNFPLDIYAKRKVNGSAFRVYSKNASGIDTERITLDGVTNAPLLKLSNGTTLWVEGTWDKGLLRLGGYRLWVDSSGNLRIKYGDVTRDDDGVIVGTQG